MIKLRFFGLLLLLLIETFFYVEPMWAQEGPPKSSETGVLLMAHGGSKSWNDQVLSIAAEVNAIMPTEVAFGMADRTTLQSRIDKLAGKGVNQIVAVPLFISSHSSVFESLEYLLGLRTNPPDDLATFAAMDHGTNKPCTPTPGSSANTGTSHAAHDSSASSAATSEKAAPVKSPVPVRMTSALDRSPVVADILLDRANAMSKDAAREVVILVAHGPNEDKENELWLADIEALAKRIAARKTFARIDYLTLRDDAEGPIRDQATAEFRKKVATTHAQGYRALIVPLLLSYGGIDGGVRKRLDGLDHVMSPQALLPDARIVQWVSDSVRQVQTASTQKSH